MDNKVIYVPNVFDNYVVYYINLDNRIDRKTHIEHELLTIFNPNNINRICAIANIKGAIGCVLSHILALTTFINSDKQFCFIFEDDFQWLYQADDINKILNNIFNSKFDIVLLTYNSQTIQFKELHQNNLCRITNGLTTAGYLLTKKFAPILLENYNQCLNFQINDKSNNILPMDVFWWELQNQNYDFYACLPCIGTQYSNFSDIEHNLVDYYNCNTFFIAIIAINTDNIIDISDRNCVYKYFVPNISCSTNLSTNVILIDSSAIGNFNIQVMKWVLTNYPNIRYIFITNDKLIQSINILNLTRFYQSIIQNKLLYQNNLVIISSFDKKIKKKKKYLSYNSI
jgi:GR25 family glycosyltransferase involved in LPS biosynthesis